MRTRHARSPTIVRWRFRHLFVDEAQDLNPLQHAVLEAIRDGRPDICLVGDHRQAIYGWNGADPSTLVEVEQRFPGVTVVALTGNYRCSPQIVRAGAAALTAAGIERRHRVASRRRAHGPRSSAPRTSTTRRARSRASCRDLVQRHGPRRVAVLARTNEQLDELGRALAAGGVCRSSAPPAARRSSSAVAEANRCTNREQLAALRRDDLGGRRRRSRSDCGSPRRSTASCRRGESGGFRAWVEARQPFDDLEPDDDDGAVALLTFHAAKGREWSGVVVTGVETGLVPHFVVVDRRAARRGGAPALRRADPCQRGARHHLGRASGDRMPTAESPLLEAVRATHAQPTRRRLPRRRCAAVRAGSTRSRPLREWRAGVARAGGVSDSAVCSDSTLRALARASRPVDAGEVAGTPRPQRRRPPSGCAPRLLSLLASIALLPEAVEHLGLHRDEQTRRPRRTASSPHVQRRRRCRSCARRPGRSGRRSAARWCSGVGERYDTSSLPVIPGLATE